MTEQHYKPASSEELAGEARQWDADDVEHLGWRDAPDAIPQAGAATLISLRVPKQMLAILKEFARREGVGYQVLMKRWLDERIRQERDALAAHSTGADPKRLHERAAANRFLEWLNHESGRQAFTSREREAPDFECNEAWGLEITTAYYDQDQAKAAWRFARGETEPRTSPVYRNPDESLAGFVSRLIQDKCQKQYAVDYPVVLVVDARPPITTERDIYERVLPEVQLPAQIPFREIYLGVDLPTSTGETSLHEGRYWAWKLYPSTGHPQPQHRSS